MIYSRTLLSLTMLALSATPSMGQVIGSGTIVVGLAPVEFRVEGKPDPNSSDQFAKASEYLAKAAAELVSNYIQRGFEKGLDRKVTIVNLPLTSSPDGSIAQPTAEVYSTVQSMGNLGIRISARLRSRADLKATQTQDLGEEVLVLSPTANFGDLDDRLTEFGIRLAKRLTEQPSTTSINSRLPRGIVGFYCVTPADAGDSKLARLARALTIELPYQISQAARKSNLEFAVRGLDLKEAVVACDPSASGIRTFATGSLDTRIENFAWTGTIARDKDKKRLTLSFRWKDMNGGGNFRPLPPLLIDESTEPSMPSIAEKLVATFAQSYERSQYKIFLHFETDAIRKSTEQKLTVALSDSGYTVIGSDPADQTIQASWIDYFSPDDCQTALEIRRTMLSTLAAGSAIAAPFLRNKQTINRPGTVGVWLSSKQVQSPPAAECPPK